MKDHNHDGKFVHARVLPESVVPILRFNTTVTQKKQTLESIHRINADNPSNKSFVAYKTSIEAKVKQFLENGGSGDICNKHLSDIISLFRIKFYNVVTRQGSLDNLQNANELENIKKLIIVGANIDYKTSGSSILYDLTHMLDNQAMLNKLDNEYKLAIQQKLEEIFACIIANDLFKLNPKITEHLIEIKEYLGEGQFAALKEGVTSEFINIMQQSHETAEHVEQSLNFIEQINPELISPLGELNTVKTNIGHMLLKCLGLLDPDAGIDQLLDIVTSNPELKGQLIDNLQQNSELRAIFQGYITLSPITAVLLQTNLQEVILEITKISSLEGIAHINIGEYNPDVASSLLGEEQKDDHLEY